MQETLAIIVLFVVIYIFVTLGGFGGSLGR